MDQLAGKNPAELLDEAEIYINFQKYDEARVIVLAALQMYPNHVRALTLKKRLDVESIDPPVNYHVAFLAGIIGVLLGLGIWFGSSSIYGKTCAGIGILGSLSIAGIVLPGFIRYRLRPYLNGESKTLFRHIGK